MSGTIFGVGTGTFAIIVVIGIAAIIFSLAPFSKSPALIRVGAVAMVGLVILIVVVTPKTSGKSGLVNTADGKANVVLEWNIVIMVMMCLGTLLSGFGVLAYHIVPDVYARPLSYHHDVLKSR